MLVGGLIGQGNELMTPEMLDPSRTEVACPLCMGEATYAPELDEDLYNCPNCGRFRMSREFKAQLKRVYMNDDRLARIRSIIGKTPRGKLPSLQLDHLRQFEFVFIDAVS